MSPPSRQEIRAQRAAAAEARRQARAAGQDGTGGEAPAEDTQAAPAPATVPSPGGEVDPVPSAASAELYRPQPFTPDLLPEPKEIAAEGELTAQEVDELGYCEAAYGNANKAEWMKWKAAHAVRSRRLYRHGGRTWPEYCEGRFGESESEVNRRIQQWPLLKRITEQQDRPRSIPDSHVQRLLPMVETHGEEVTAFAYVQMRKWGADRKQRITAEVVGQVVKLAKTAEAPTLATGNLFQQAIEAKPKSSTKHKKLVVAKPEPSPAPTAEAEGAEQDESHPNLGDQLPETDGDEEHQVPEATPAEAGTGEDEQHQKPDVDPFAARAQYVASQLAGMSKGFVETGLLQGASAETLKTIVEAARSLAEAAEAELSTR